MSWIEICQSLELEEYVSRRIWIDRYIDPSLVNWDRVGLVAISGKGTWTWRFRRQEDATLFNMVWS